MEETSPLVARAALGFAELPVAEAARAAALEGLSHWLSEPALLAYQPQLQAAIEAGRWAELLDAFCQVLPFGTGGRRGAVGIGPNRINAWTIATSAQGHATWLRRARGPGPLRVVIGYDVRRFDDLDRHSLPGVADPVLGLSSRDLARVAAEVYAAADIAVSLPVDGEWLSTPELSFAVRELGADAGLMISASHNPPGDNGAKLYLAHGGQVVPPLDEEMAREVAAVARVERMPLDRARSAGLVEDIGPEVHEAWLQLNLGLISGASSRALRIVFTPLHGTGIRTVYELLQRAGFEVHLEPTQAEPDGAFPAVPAHAPNPERPEAMAAAAALADDLGADLVFATDPDADRLGLMARGADGLLRPFTGDELAAVVCDTALRRRLHTTPPVVFKTEVTSSLVSRVARARGARVVGDLLVGFKYIGEALDQIERTGSYGGVNCSLADFALGCEESHGLLLTPGIRDKDAAGGALVLAARAAAEKVSGRTLVSVLDDLQGEVGPVVNRLFNLVMRGAGGRSRIQAIQASLRREPLQELAGLAISRFVDHQDPSGRFGPIRSETDRSSRDVLLFELGAAGRFIIRPSGTEPKSKIYLELTNPDLDVGQVGRALVAALLARVEIALPDWVLYASDLLPIEHKRELSERLVPALVQGLEEGVEQSALRREVDAALRGWGAGAKALVQPAITRFMEEGGAEGLSLLFE